MINFVFDIVCAIFAIIGAYFAFKVYYLLDNKLVLALVAMAIWQGVVRILMACQHVNMYICTADLLDRLLVVSYFLFFYAMIALWQSVKQFAKKKGHSIYRNR